MFGQLFSRIKDAERSLETTIGSEISSPQARRRARWHLLFVDHGILRGFWTNLHEIAPGVWRSNQPDGKRIAAYKNMGMRAVVNLRGTRRRSNYLFEQEACAAHGITLVSHALSARSLVKREVLLALLDTFETIERPFVMHCKSGADRAGLAAALYLLHMTSATPAQARQQLSIRYLHIRTSKTGILDHMLDAFQADHERSPIAIKDWLANKYDRDALTQSFANAKRGQGPTA